MYEFGDRMDVGIALAVILPVTFVAVAIWEARRPSRPQSTSLALRWFGNFALFGLGLVVVRALPFVSGLGMAMLAREHGWGLFNLVAMPFVAAAVLSFVAFDFFLYWTHYLFHMVSPLWRLHALHHSDPDLDVATTVRHHPLETVMQALFDASIAALMGLTPEAIALYGGLVFVFQSVQHGNVVLPQRLRWLNAWLMTPDLHRLHHSMREQETNSNFGNLVPLWDRIFGTLRLDPECELRIGLPQFVGDRFQRLDMLLVQPLLVSAVPGSGR